MSAGAAFLGRRLAAAALARAEAFLLEPLDAMPRPVAITLRPAVAVVALGPACGATTVARALAVELGGRDPTGAAAVAGRSGGLVAPGSGPARTLCRAIGAGAGERVRAAGRLCLVEGGEPRRLADAVRHLAPLAIDIGYGEPAGVAASIADHVLLVASPETEPALADAVAASLGRIGPPPIVALNRAEEGGAGVERWRGRATAILARSALGARLALAGRGGVRAFGHGLGELGEMCAAVRSDW